MLVARYALPAVPAAIICLVAVVARGPRTAHVLLGLTLAVAMATTVVQQTKPFKYENFRAATKAVTDAARPGDGVIFLPESYRVDYICYLPAGRHDPADVALAPGDQLHTSTTIGGRELPPDTIMTSIRSTPRIFLIGVTLPVAARTRHSRSDRAKETALATYHPLWHHEYGEITVTLLSRSIPTGPQPSTGRPLRAAPGRR